ncbi:hypothetical protein D039_2446A, partial [Vibrio parahaemolyticus EKP-028]
MRWDDHF